MKYPDTFAVEVNSDKFILQDLLKSLQNNGVILMQYTGLQDKNGKPIYEGDIVQYKSGTDKSYTPTQLKPKVVEYKVMRNAVGFNLGSTNRNQAISYEVIGNVWENTELLNV